MTLNDLVGRVLDILADPDGTRWTSTEVTSYLDEAQRDFAIDTGMLRAQATLALTTQTGLSPNTAYYDLPVDFVSLDRVESAGLELVRLDMPSLARNSGNWQASAGSPYNYLWGNWGPSTIRVYPAPLPNPAAWMASTAYAPGTQVLNSGNIYTVTTAGTSGTGTSPTGTGTAIVDGTVTWAYAGTSNVLTSLVAYYLRMPKALADTNAPELPAQYHWALVNYAVSRAYQKNFEAADATKAAQYLQSYEQQKLQARANFSIGPKLISYRSF